MKLSSSFSNFLYVVSVIVATAIPVLTVNAQTAESDSLYSEGMTLFEQGKYKNAIEKFRQVWELDSINVPEYMPAYESGKDWMAYSYIKMGNEKMAKHLNPLVYDIAPDDRRKFGRINDFFGQYHEDMMNRMWVLGEMHLSSAVDEAEKVFGRQSVIYSQALVGLTTFHLNQNNEKKLNECINKLEKVMADLPVKNKYLSAFYHLMKGWSDFYRNKFAESLAEARKCRELLKGLEKDAWFETAKMSDLFGVLVFYADQEIFTSRQAALAELKNIIDGNIDTYFSLPDDKLISGADIMGYALDILVHYPNVNSDEYDDRIARYIEILRGADREKYPYMDNSLSYALYCRGMINNVKANQTGKGYEKVWEITGEAMKLAEASATIEKKDCLELMMVGANALIALQRYDEADEIMDEVLPIAADKSNQQEYFLIDAVNGKSLINQRKGRMDLAIETMRKYLSAIRNMKNKYPSEVATLLKDYADIIGYDKRNLKEYASVIKEVIACYETLDYPEFQSGYLNSLHCLATMHGQTPAGTEEIFEKLESKIEKLKANPLAPAEYVMYQEASLLNGRAMLAQSQNEPDKALEYNTRAIELGKKSGYAERSDLLNTRLHIYKDQSNYSEALKVGEELLALCNRVYGHEDPTTIQIMSEMIDIYGGNLRYDMAEEMVNEIMKLLDISFKSLSPEFMTQTLILIGTYYNNVRNYGMALEILERAKKLMAQREVEAVWELPLLTAYLNAKCKTDHKDEVFTECKALIAGMDGKNYTPFERFQLLTSLGFIAKELGEIGYASDWFEKGYEEYELPEDEFNIFYINCLCSMKGNIH